MGFQNYSILKVAFLTPNGASSQTNWLKGLKNIMAINDIFSPRWSNLFWDTEPLYKCLVYTVKSLMVGVFPQWEIQLSCCKWDKELFLLSTTDSSHLSTWNHSFAHYVCNPKAYDLRLYISSVLTIPTIYLSNLID